MAINLPPPPQQAEPGSRLWNDWFRNLQLLLSSSEGVAWGQIDKTGSSLADLAVRLHSSLTGIQGTGSNHISDAENDALTALTLLGHQSLFNVNGTGDYHVSSDEAATVTELNSRNILDVLSKVGDPDTSDIPDGKWAIYKNTSSGDVGLWVNDGGVMKSTLLT